MSPITIALRLGRFFFATGIAVFGIQYLLYGRFVGGLPPMPQWIAGGPFWAYVTGAVLLAGSLGIAAKKPRFASATFLGLGFLLCVIVLHGPRVVAILHDGVMRTRAFEPLAISGAAFVLAGMVPNRHLSASQLISPHREVDLGRVLFALPMVVFGIQHFLYADFVASLIPHWIPGHLFWVYLTGSGFIAAALSILARVYARLGATMLGAMFLFWALFLHAPRVAAAIRNGDEWSSAFVALTLSGGSLVVAESFRGKSRGRIESGAGKNQLSAVQAAEERVRCA
jgi:uncharacterized membrane protein